MEETWKKILERYKLKLKALKEERTKKRMIGKIRNKNFKLVNHELTKDLKGKLLFEEEFPGLMYVKGGNKDYESVEKDIEKMLEEANNEKEQKELVKELEKLKQSFFSNGLFNIDLPLEDIIHKLTQRDQENPPSLFNNQMF